MWSGKIRFIILQEMTKIDSVPIHCHHGEPCFLYLWLHFLEYLLPPWLVILGAVWSNWKDGQITFLLAKLFHALIGWGIAQKLQIYFQSAMISLWPSRRGTSFVWFFNILSRRGVSFLSVVVSNQSLMTSLLPLRNRDLTTYGLQQTVKSSFWPIKRKDVLGNPFCN